ncbi:MAG: acyl-CoA dehydrogenase family protein [Salaquimonas sp.]|nr:acyl-CoA dehydrogenase family protein [Salaquimonas sp.]
MNESILDTHAVFNQSPIYGGHNAWTADPLLKRIVGDIPPAVKKNLESHGGWAGHLETYELARLANKHTPTLKTHDAKGNRLDIVEFHPAYHALMRRSMAAGMHCSIWDDDKEEAGKRNLIRAARYYMTAGTETGHLCPITMTNAAIAALVGTPQVADEWLPRARSRKYDSSNQPPINKSAITLGMGMTEKQGGTDVRANTTRAEALGDGLYRIVGHKWFMSAPMCDAFLVLAQMAEGNQTGLGCFLIPRILPDGTPNGLQFQRLKDKLGNRSNASSEVEFHGAFGQLIGEPGRGVPTIIEMVTLTRLDCATASSGLMRASVAEAVQHTRYRKVFGETLAHQPLMSRVLADLALDVAAATALAMRLASSFDRMRDDPAEAAYARLMTPVIKYWVCKSAAPLIGEAMECLGGNGYVEEGNLARHFREAPVNAIWEGSGNVMCLDVMRVIARDGDTLGTVLDTLEADLGGKSAAKTVEVIRTAASMAGSDHGSARILTEQLALTAAGAELRRLDLGEIADLFVETRLGGLWRSTYGMLDNRHDTARIVDTLYPQS